VQRLVNRVPARLVPQHSKTANNANTALLTFLAALGFRSDRAEGHRLLVCSALGRLCCMNTLARYVISISATSALLAACGGSQPLIDAPGGMPQSRVSTVQADRSESWVLPEAAASDLLYVGGNDAAYLSMYTYPKGKLVGVIKNHNFSWLGGECVDAKGDVFVSSFYNGKIFEYKHGSTKLLETLDVPTGEHPLDCSVDPTSGNLAVTLLQGAHGTEGGVAIYAHAQGSPQIYTAPHVYSYYFCGYDSKGNLFVDGRNFGPFRFAELPAGSSNFIDISLNQTIKIPGSVLWDGKYLAVGDQAAPDVYEFTIKGSRGTLVHTTPINNVTDDRAFWIQNKRIVVANRVMFGPELPSRYRRVEFFAYPAGGDATKHVVLKGVIALNGLTVSHSPH
jgi:hypothetical protein